ncbi:MAG: hypothetical protein CMI55_03770 [Parcubacteria group bacterium]|jgi:hypothetical protein|nr:hypothetical protein [Parcubacteria group bacterium]|tara:strand:- start:8408 stop:9019 length:612 start_codon:yes stop_codon:yes gene_type:complete
MNKILKIAGLIFLIILAVFAIRFLIGGSEDDWICLDDQWVKHGAPSNAPPETGCGEINSFADCAKAGYPVMESYPRQCRASGDKVFVEDIGNEMEKMDLIIISYPRPNQAIESPLDIEGQARGSWFFEGDFPVVLTDWDGLIIAEGYAMAQGNWMTEDFVEFKARFDFKKPQLYDNGTLILRRDNPSGLPENDDALEVPIFFK